MATQYSGQQQDAAPSLPSYQSSTEGSHHVQGPSSPQVPLQPSFPQSQQSQIQQLDPQPGFVSQSFPPENYSMGSGGPVAPNSAPKELGLYYVSKLSRDLAIRDAYKNDIYDVEMHSGFSSKPDVMLFRGPGTGQPIGNALFRSWSSSIDITFGDSSRLEDVYHEKMQSEGFFTPAYHINMPMVYAGGVIKPRSFVWKSTSSEGGSGLGGSLKLVDSQTQEVVAVFLSQSMAWKKWGKFQFRKDWGEKWEAAVILTGVALLEKQSRRSRSSASGGGGGGAC
ncbi:MAG: hypothetical protein M1814_006065 [Vezdaea aestivalis]|nr:MAG: hypothetical protein M1814_006065 [Vezdaea aestivalis]